MYSTKTISGFGKEGEDFAVDYLRKNGYIIIKQNFSSRFGEIDIIAEDSEYIVFVEVKTRTDNALVSGAEAVDAYKINRIRNLANDFIRKFHTEKSYRFDVCEVIFNTSEKEFTLNHIKSAF